MCSSNMKCWRSSSFLSIEALKTFRSNLIRRRESLVLSKTWCAKERLLERLILFLGRVANDWMRTWIWVEPTGMETALHCCFLCLESNLERNWKKHRRLIKLQHPTFCCIAFEVRYFSYPLYTCITLLKSLFEHLIQNCGGGGGRGWDFYQMWYFSSHLFSDGSSQCTMSTQN